MPARNFLHGHDFPSSATATIGTRIHVIGNSASGKSTLGARLAKALDAAFVELDAINWQPGWITTQHARKRRTMTACLSDPRWAHIRFVRLRSSREVEEFARSVERVVQDEDVLVS